MRISTTVIPAGSSEALHQALAVLSAGGLVAFPTDTVYGVAAGAYDRPGIRRLYAVKEREREKAIPILVGRIEDVEQVSQDLSPFAWRLAERFWPGPLTLVVPRHPALPDELAPELTIGVRMPDHPVALALLRRSGPLAVTSANLSGGVNTRTAGEVLAQLGGRVELILDGGRTPGGSPSTVVDCTGPEFRVLRPGPIGEAELLAVE